MPLTAIVIKVSDCIDRTGEITIECSAYSTDANNNLCVQNERGEILLTINADYWYYVK
jgi:hypothetical protein